MSILSRISAVLGFRVIPTTALLVVIYTVILSTVLWTDELQDVPKNQWGLDVYQGYTDLHHIAARPHPYNSHSNDLVRSYILERLVNLTSGYRYVHIADDLVHNVTFAFPGSIHVKPVHPIGVYFEGTNILVKIDGSDRNYRDEGGVLFSAHYDSVSTAAGATDDGMGVATLIQLVEYFIKNRPSRTAVFNINNGEESGLHGAHAFLEHPWSNVTDTFLNLEGAASGGRPILFRATSIAPLLSFYDQRVPHPHSNVLSADAFARGIIRSGTDYSVYARGLGHGMEGLDLAFYKGRSKYHTKYDAIPDTEGGEKALWAMMETARGAGVSLLNDDDTHAGGGRSTSVVYFDLFGTALVVFSMNALLVFNIVLLVVGPLIVLFLIVIDSVVDYSRRRLYQNGHEVDSDTVWKKALRSFESMDWLKGLWRHAKFWMALVVGVVLQAFLVLGYAQLNPFIIYSHPYTVLVSTFTLAYLSTVLILKLPIAAHGFVLPEQQKLIALQQSYVLTWLLLLLSTFALGQAKIGAVYLFSAWNLVVFLGCVLGSLEGIFGAKGTSGEGDSGENQRLVRGVRFEADEHGASQVVETEATEITPLIRQNQTRSRSPRQNDDEEGGAIAWWILQLVIVVPIPVILISHIAVLVMSGMTQSLADGSSAVVVYAATSLVSTLLILPLAPFSIKLHRSLTFLMIIVFFISTLYSWLAFPFSQDAPLKVFFQQRVELDLHNTSFSDIHAVTRLTGAPTYLKRAILPHLPSTWRVDTNCFKDSFKPGLVTCEWNSSKLTPAPSANVSGSRSSDWLTVETTRLSRASALISVKGTNTRSCRLYFDNKNITYYHIDGSGRQVGNRGDEMQTGYEIPEGGLSEIQLWSRTWDRDFSVKVGWDRDGDGALSGRVSCNWDEYESATVGGGCTGARIPAYEELLNFLPTWAVASKATDGLVEASGTFSV